MCFCRVLTVECLWPGPSGNGESVQHFYVRCREVLAAMAAMAAMVRGRICRTEKHCVYAVHLKERYDDMLYVLYG